MIESLGWWLLLLVAVWLTHWGADKLAEPLQKLRQQWGFSAAAGGVLIAAATSSPEISTNAVSAIRGVADIGIGNLLGSNIISVPAIVTVAYLATRGRVRQAPGHSQRENPHTNAIDGLLPVTEGANTVQAFPYIAIVALVGVLTLPAPWRGLQPVDGWIMLVAYVIYVVHAFVRQREEGEAVQWSVREAVIAMAGIAMLVVGAYVTVWSTEHIVDALDISDMIGGLFITATMSIVPEAIATWSIARSGQITSATTSVIADNTATMTLAFFPLALVSTSVNDFQLFWVNLFFVGLLGVAYAFFVMHNSAERGFDVPEILALNGLYIVYILVMVIGVFNLV